jgi:hypothetical protein
MNMRYHHDYPYFRWDRFTIFKHYRPMMGQIIRGRIFPLFTRPDKNTEKEKGGQNTRQTGVLASSPMFRWLAVKLSRQLKIKIKSNGNPRND